MTLTSMLQTRRAKAVGAALFAAAATASPAAGAIASSAASAPQPLTGASAPVTSPPTAASPSSTALATTSGAVVAVVEGASSEIQSAAGAVTGSGSSATPTPPTAGLPNTSSQQPVAPGTSPHQGAPAPVPAGPQAPPLAHALVPRAGAPSTDTRHPSASSSGAEHAGGGAGATPAPTGAVGGGAAAGPQHTSTPSRAAVATPITQRVSSDRARPGAARQAFGTGGSPAPSVRSAPAATAPGAASISADARAWRGGDGPAGEQAGASTHALARNAPASVSRAPSWSESLFGVGLPSTDLSLLLLIPLLVIGLTIAEVLVSGRRKGPLDRYFRRAVAPGVWTARRQRDWHLGE